MMCRYNSINIAVLVSGGGTNLQAIINACKKGIIKARLRLVVSNRKAAYAIIRAKKAGIETLILDDKIYPARLAYAKKLARELQKRKIGLVCLAGFMHILDPYFIRRFKNKIMNIHPALLPCFGGEGMYGHYVHGTVLKSGAKFSGCSVHFVDEGCDTGPIIMQKVVPVKDEDTIESLASRVLKYEHQIYPQAIKLFTEGKLRIRGKRVSIRS